MTDFENEGFPLAQKIIDYALQNGKAAGVTDVRVNIGLTEKSSYTIDHGNLVKVVSGGGRGVGVALYAGDRKFAFSKNTMDETALLDAVRQSIGVIGVAPESPHTRLLEPALVYKGAPVDLDFVDQAPPDRAALVAYLKDFEAGVYSLAGIKTARGIKISATTEESLSLATNGLRKYLRETSYSASAEVVAEDASGMQAGGEHSFARHFADMAAPHDLGVAAAKDALSRLGAVVPPTMENASIILSPDAAAEFVDTVFQAIDGGAVYGKETFLAGKVGQQVMSGGVTIVDDPRIVRGLKSDFTDGAGMEAKPITFIENGVLKGYNVSLAEARRLGVAPIGRSNGPTNVTVLPGAVAPADLMKDIKDGVYIRSFEGGEADVNNRNCSLQAYGALIKDGQVTNTPVKGFIVAGDLADMFMRVTLANDTPALPSNRIVLAAPTMRIDGVTVAGL